MAAAIATCFADRRSRHNDKVVTSTTVAAAFAVTDSKRRNQAEDVFGVLPGLNLTRRSAAKPLELVSAEE